jgi:predicted PhzF superfamily epimerase YddE/YHI9
VVEPPGLSEALRATAIDVAANDFNYLVRLESAGIVRQLVPDLAAIAHLDRPGIIVTAAGDGPYDFVSRYFAPAKGIAEDPVTGAAHCALAPYWAKRLHKSAFRAYQASQRGGEVLCRLKQGRVELEGTCVFYLEGNAEI